MMCVHKEITRVRHRRRRRRQCHQSSCAWCTCAHMTFSSLAPPACEPESELAPAAAQPSDSSSSKGSSFTSTSTTKTSRNSTTRSRSWSSGLWSHFGLLWFLLLSLSLSQRGLVLLVNGATFHDSVRLLHESNLTAAELEHAHTHGHVEEVETRAEAGAPLSLAHRSVDEFDPQTGGTPELIIYGQELDSDGRPQRECGCWNTSSDGGRREVECKCDGRGLKRLGSNLPPDVYRITVAESTSFLSLGPEQLRPYQKSLREIILSDLPSFHEIQNYTFDGMENLNTIYIHDTPSLIHLSDFVFSGGNLTHLKLIKIHHSSLVQVPNFSQLRLPPNSLLHTLDLENNKIKTINPGWVANLQVDYLALSYNQLEQIGPNSFAGAKIARLTLKGNHQLKRLDPAAFVRIASLRQLDLSETAITKLPTLGLEQIESLRLENVFSLTVIPSIYHFQGLQEAWLTFPFHCCAFAFPERHDSFEFGKYKELIAGKQATCEGTETQTSVPGPTSPAAGSTTPQIGALPPIITRSRSRRRKRDVTDLTLNMPSQFRSRRSKRSGFNSSSSSSHSSSSHDHDDFGFGTFHESVPTLPSVTKLCGNLTMKKPHEVQCHPLPDAFSPCEDIMGNLWLRAGVWIVVALALVGNTAVLVVLLLAPGRMSVQRFLMANLSLADLSMGLYLLMVASEDLVSLGTYFNYAIEWQQGWGCQVAGFFTVFASELSVFTLVVITGERWYALTRAMHLTKRLTIAGAAELMTVGWILSIILASLPLVGVSSYSKTSICLPMEASTLGSQSYLIFLLLFNGVSFFLVALAYWQMYRAVASHGTAATSAHIADAAVAKKMSLLVFTDFACWAPVAFFGLTAVAGHPLIGITDSKILLVFFYPLNACCNPYLYAILTKQYRRDLLLLLSSFGDAAGGGGGRNSPSQSPGFQDAIRRHFSLPQTSPQKKQIKMAAKASSRAGVKRKGSNSHSQDGQSHHGALQRDHDVEMAETTFSFVQLQPPPSHPTPEFSIDDKSTRTNNGRQYIRVPVEEEEVNAQKSVTNAKCQRDPFNKSTEL